MSDQTQPTTPDWASIPSDMLVASTAKLFATNVSEDGRVWLWVRYSFACIAVDFDPDAAETIAAALREGATEARRRRGPQLDVVTPSLLGPDGRPA